MIFKDAVEQFLELHINTWRNAKHWQQWRNTLGDYAYPTLRSRPVGAIDRAHQRCAGWHLDKEA